MKLSYRGIKYEREPVDFEMRQGEVVGQYRGQQWNVEYAYPRHIPVPQASLDLKYRGISYRTNVISEVESALAERSLLTPQSAQVSTAASSSLDNVRQRLLKEVAETHRLNIYRSLERRLQAAKERGDQNLIRLLENELQQIA